MALSESVAPDSRSLLREQTMLALRRSHRWFFALTLVLMATVLTGFWPTYFSKLLSGGGARPVVMQVHGAVFTGWTLLLLVQVSLAATGRVHAHRRVGTFGIWYGVLVWIMGVVATFAAPVIHVHRGEWTPDQAAGFLILPIGDMILFGGFFGAAINYRHKPEVHKRLIIAATVALAFAAIGRLNFSPAVSFVVWMTPMAALAAFDALSAKRLHRVTLVSSVLLAIAFLRIPLTESPGWIAIGRVLLHPFL